MIGEVSKHPDEMLVVVLCVGTVVFYGVATAFQKVGLGDIVP